MPQPQLSFFFLDYLLCCPHEQGLLLQLLLQLDCWQWEQVCSQWIFLQALLYPEQESFDLPLTLQQLHFCWGFLQPHVLMIWDSPPSV